jgi:hypothetical protein
VNDAGKPLLVPFGTGPPPASLRRSILAGYALRPMPWSDPSSAPLFLIFFHTLSLTLACPISGYPAECRAASQSYPQRSKEVMCTGEVPHSDQGARWRGQGMEGYRM